MPAATLIIDDGDPPVLPEPQPFAEYLVGIRALERQEAERNALERRAAMSDAHRMAFELREKYGASAVYAVGSVCGGGAFDDRSDIDLAASGIAPERFFRAWADIAAMTRREVDLVDLDACPERLRNLVLEQGEQL